MRVLALVVATVALLAGCGGDDEAAQTTSTETTTTEPAEGAARMSVYWLLDGKVWPAQREVFASQELTSQGLSYLTIGPNKQERDIGLTTAIPAGGWNARVKSDAGTVRIELGGTELSRDALAEVVYTLTQFPAVKILEIDGTRYTRADFEDLTPAILVESPLAFEDVDSPLRVTGTANTFEANFEYELTDTDGRIVDESFVTATSGSGERGTFDFTTDAYTVPFDGVGALIVFERSAKDGSRINLVEIPLRMTR